MSSYLVIINNYNQIITKFYKFDLIHIYYQQCIYNN
jgi:hypothetical protein